MKDNKLILWFDTIELADLAQVGGKNASLGEMRKELISKGVNIPDGFAVTAHAYRHLLSYSGITGEITKLLSDLNTHDIKNLSDRGKKIRSLIYNAKFPDDLREEIIQAYKKL
ncbi:MAG: PEP/pyruvate-binding domain-containing protein, partial [Smithella sp.]